MIRKGFIVFIVSLILFSCTEDKSKPAIKDNKFTSKLLTDDLGRTIEINKVPQRVISLAPSITEIMYFVGAEKQLVSRTQACDYPSKAEKLPVVNTYPLDIESIVKLNPDVVISVDGIVNTDQVKKLEELGIKVFFQKYETIDDINKSIVVIGSMLGRGERASFLVDSLNQELENIKVINEKPLQVLNITWVKPIFIYGTDTPFTSKIEAAGGENAMKDTLYSPYPEVTREYILKMNPDVIISNSFEKMHTTFFTHYPELKSVNAYKKKQVFDVDDNLMSRPSPRYIESVIELKEILNKCK